MTTFQKIPPADRQLIMAKIFHHAWYDDNRARFLLEILQDWENNPCKEVKFFNQIHNENGNENYSQQVRNWNLFD